MSTEKTNPPTGHIGSWQDAETLRRWSFARRSPQQRFDWLVAALTIKYEAAEARAVIRQRLRDKS